ncbi:hypothetical protein [Gulosibacter molinativorax]|uniref:Asparagine synthetase domain-containing protein n=1 Tax=Gulosibacter molinativorax TaxID=256821 RepID=A0ABT7C6Z3_9MICO|nr:hypothetical protein [Gulosibacter molinativorax]MDJ1370959.1 hypothetical protein [Gulosibacter molinativorax]QUY62750.1 Hypotetical protein [Gulosibacter molinativorax]
MFGQRSETKRLKTLADLEQRQQRLRPAYKIWGYKNVFAKGFLITKGAIDYAPHEKWETLEFGPWRAQLDPELERQSASYGDFGILILGQVFDDRGPAKRHEIAARLLKTLRSVEPRPLAEPVEDLAEPVEVPRKAMDEAITWLSGRYVVFVRRGETLDIYGDPMATRSCYWHDTGESVALTSHTAILSELVGGLPSKRMQWILRHPDYKSPAGKWLPGLITPHDEVGQIFANGRLTVRGREVTNQRFYPSEDRTELSLDEAAEMFREELQQQVRNWIAVAPQTVLALTAGSDSRAVLEAGIVDLQEAEAVTLTYHPFHVAKKSTYDDLVQANRVAAAARLPQLVLDVAQMTPTSQMARLYTRTFPTWQRYANLANAFYVGAPAKAAMLFGIGGGIATGVYKDRSASAPTTELLAKKYAQSKVASDSELQQEMARWTVFADFSVEHLRGYDFHDFFHWEHRLSKWAGAGYSEYDLATIPAPVFSSRRLLSTALSVTLEHRESKSLYARLRQP